MLVVAMCLLISAQQANATLVGIRFDATVDMAQIGQTQTLFGVGPNAGVLQNITVATMYVDTDRSVPIFLPASTPHQGPGTLPWITDLYGFVSSDIVFMSASFGGKSWSKTFRDLEAAPSQIANLWLDAPLVKGSIPHTFARIEDVDGYLRLGRGICNSIYGPGCYLQDAIYLKDDSTGAELRGPLTATVFSVSEPATFALLVFAIAGCCVLLGRQGVDHPF